MARTLQSSLRTLDERSLLSGVYTARLAVAYALAVAATVVRTTTVTEPSTPLVLLIVGVPTVFTLVSWIYGKSRQLSSRFLGTQVIHDLLLITVAVLLTGGIGSEFALFYILLVATAGLLLGLRGSMVTAATVVIVYLATAY
jgi:two-component system sensor histidine kinase PilS (NtrC family)